MNLIKEAAKFIVWLSGALAGIGAIFVASGYLITIANLKLLGLESSVVSYDTQFYLKRGGNFFYYLIEFLSEKILLHLSVLIVMIAIMAILIYVFVGSFHSSVGKPIKDKVLGHVSKYSLRYKVLVFVLLWVVLFIDLLPALRTLFVDPLDVSNVLYDPTGADLSPERRAILTEIREAQRDFTPVLIAVVKAGVLLLIARWAASTLPLRMILISPFVIIFVSYILLMPMVYGVLRIPIEFSPITISTSDELISERSAGLYLINRTDKEFVLWDATAKRLLWIPQNQVGPASILKSEPVFKKP